MAFLICFACAGPTFAQDTTNRAAGEAQPSPQPTSPDDRPEAEAPDDVTFLKSRFGIDVTTLDLDSVTARLAEAEREFADLTARQAVMEEQFEVRARIGAVLGARAEGLSEESLPAYVTALASRGLESARVASVASVLDRAAQDHKRLVGALEQVQRELEARAAREAERLSQAQVESERAERAALAAVELARQRERDERDEALKDLFAKERRLAEELLAATREHSETLRTLQQQTEAAIKTFADRKADLLAHIDEIPVEPTPEQRHTTVDPAFEEVVTLRRQARAQLEEARKELRDAEGAVVEATARVAVAQRSVEEERARREQLEEAVADQRLAVARAQLELAKHRQRAASQIRDAVARRVEEFRVRVKFFDRALEQLFPNISAGQRAKFFTIADEANWTDALAATRGGIRRLASGAVYRWTQLRRASWTSVTVWGWVGNFFFRVLVVVVGLRLLIPLVPIQVGKLTAALFRRQFFRKRPRVTVKSAEIVHSVATPLLLYAGIRWIVDYVELAFPEARFLMWLVNAAFLYWVVIAVVSVLALPRGFRRARGETSATEYTHIKEAEADAMADVLGLDVTAARKLVRSVKVVVGFSLFALLLPRVVLEVTGYTLIWWLVRRVGWVGLIVLLFWVASTWKDNIASAFGRVARERIPRAVAQVEKRKDRIYGVLLVAFAGIYVAVAALAGFVRKHALKTRMVKRASTFAFRKKIEMQAREDEVTRPATSTEELPPDYVEPFRIEALPAGSKYFVQRGTWETDVQQRFSGWVEGKAQGSVALIGEHGIGKTTTMNHIREALHEPEPHIEVIWHSVAHKHHRRRDVLEFIAELFGLEEAPTRTRDLIDALFEVDRRIVMLDDCHHFFIRQIGGFDGLETLLDVVNLTDERHFWVLSFNVYAWSYMNRVSAREHYFGEVIDLGQWTEEQIQALIEKRSQPTGYAISFSELVDVHDVGSGEQRFYEVVKTARGYFRYLHEFSDGNPSVSLFFWLRSLHLSGDETLQVHLFPRPKMEEIATISDDHWFVLTALAQHGELDAAEMASIINVDEGFCYLALNFFEEKGVVRFLDEGRAALTPLYFRQVLRWLANANYLYH